MVGPGLGAFAAVAAATFLLSSCHSTRAATNRPLDLPAPDSGEGAVALAPKTVRATGTVQAVRTLTVRVPQLAQISGRNPQLTLTALALNGTPVKRGDLLVTFDATAQTDDLREAKAKMQDLQHQLDEKRAQVNSDAAKRLAQIREAEVDLGKAEVQLKKGPVLAESLSENWIC